MFSPRHGYYLGEEHRGRPLNIHMLTVDRRLQSQLLLALTNFLVDQHSNHQTHDTVNGFDGAIPTFPL